MILLSDTWNWNSLCKLSSNKSNNELHKIEEPFADRTFSLPLSIFNFIKLFYFILLIII